MTHLQHPIGLVTLFFDTKTFELRGNQVTIEKDGKRVLFSPIHYQANYRDNAGNTFTIRTWGQPIKDASWADETYTTASGLVLFFVEEVGVSLTGGQHTSAGINTPEGMSYAVNSTLPRETIKEWAENLVLAK